MWRVVLLVVVGLAAVTRAGDFQEIGGVDSAVHPALAGKECPSNMVYKSYQIRLHNINDYAVQHCLELAGLEDSELSAYKGFYRTLEDVFAKQGKVSWPQGAFAVYVAPACELVVVNTVENQKKVKDVVGSWRMMPVQVEVKVSFVVYDVAAIAKLGLAGGGAELIKLWESGGGRLVAEPVCVSQSGQQAVVKADRIAVSASGVSSAGASNVVGNVAAKVSGNSGGGEFGVMLDMLPEISPDGSLANIALSLELDEPAALDTEGEWGRQRYSLQTAVVLQNGQAMRVGGGISSRDGKRLMYMFVRMRFRDVNGDYIPVR